MKYVSYTPGGPEAMRISEGPAPSPQPGEILIEVHFAGINRPDVMQRQGKYPPPPGASTILGLEVSGRVAALGEGASEWKVGDEVTALAPGGGYAEFCVVPASHALPIPKNLGLREAASLPENWFTVWANLIDLCKLKAGERLLIHGGSSGIGLAAIQLGKFIGCEVFVTVGSVEKAVACHAFGADHAINYRSEDFAARINEITGKQGVDVILDMVGAPYMQKNVALLRKDGRLCIIAFLEGSKTEFDFLPILLKRLTITGSAMRPRTVEEKASIRAALRARLWPAIEAGQVRTHVHAVFALADVTEAHWLMESSRHIGKILLQVR